MVTILSAGRSRAMVWAGNPYAQKMGDAWSDECAAHQAGGGEAPYFQPPPSTRYSDTRFWTCAAWTCTTACCATNSERCASSTSR